jgi:hypothetical protein
MASIAEDDRKRGFQRIVKLNGVKFLFVLSFLGALGALAFSSRAADQVKGVSLAHLHRRGMGYGSDDCRAQLKAIADVGANWIAIADFGFMSSVTDPHIKFGGDRSLTEADLVKCIDDAHATGLKGAAQAGHLVPRFQPPEEVARRHRDDFRGRLGHLVSPSTPKFILHHAQLAQSAKADGFCVGMELEGTSRRKRAGGLSSPRCGKVYTGPLTYAAAYGEWPHIQWWDAVDCIGVNGYFPLTGKESTDEADLRRGWAVVYGFLEPFAKKWNKPICFTELGYSESVRAGLEPWEYNVVGSDKEYQARLYRIAVEEAAKRDFIVGIFAWKWFTSDQGPRMERHDPFGIQDRPLVLDSLRRAWKKP